ncbi:MAG: hypothetical protein D6706_18510 [Chloroflexi bacterium]|nr:MAG: hypothetical protein D6706_18510 [Chloroflexota bacterium]
MAIIHETLEPYINRYVGLRVEPLKIEVRFVTAPALYDPLRIDALLSFAVVREATEGLGLPDSAEPYAIPLPLRCAWQHPTHNLPLWCSTDLMPIDQVEVLEMRYFKREPHPAYAKKNKDGRWNLRTTQGKYKQHAGAALQHLSRSMVWRGYCEGNEDEVIRLLSQITHCGKKTSQGFGMVAEWRIEKVDRFSFTDEEGRLLRPIPTLFYGDRQSGAFIGWTPPYWLPACQDYCLVWGDYVDESS